MTDHQYQPGDIVRIVKAIPGEEDLNLARYEGTVVILGHVEERYGDIWPHEAYEVNVGPGDVWAFAEIELVTAAESGEDGADLPPSPEADALDRIAAVMDRETLAITLSKARHPVRWDYRATSTPQDADYAQADAVIAEIAAILKETGR